VNALAAAAIAAGELVCEFSDAHRSSLLVYEAVRADRAEVLSTQKPGRRAVEVHATGERLHLVDRDGRSVRMTTLTGCARTHPLLGEERCTRFEARHAWHFDATAHLDPDAAYERLPSGSAAGSCEPWRVER
jgi:hypothetical protein